MTETEPFWHHISLTDASFQIAYREGVDQGLITNPQGWVTDELQITEGTCAAIRTEAHRIIDIAVATGRYPSYYPKAAAAECKRVLTKWCTVAQSTHTPRWRPSHRHTSYGGEPTT